MGTECPKIFGKNGTGLLNTDYADLRMPVSISFNTIPPASIASMSNTASPRRTTSCLMVKTPPTVIPVSAISRPPSRSGFVSFGSSLMFCAPCETSVKRQIRKSQPFNTNLKMNDSWLSYSMPY